MQSVSSKKIKTFTVGFDNPNYNEAKQAKKISGYLNTDHSGTTGKGSFARVGYMNIKWHDKNKSEEDLKDAWNSYDNQ